MLQYKIPTRGEYGSMKRRKSTWMILLAVVLSVAMVISGMSFVAFGAIEGTQNTLINNVDMPSKVEYGKTFVIPAVADVAADAITVTAPNGKDATKNGNTVTADQVGTYTVTFSKGTKGEDGYQSYDFYVYSSVAHDYEIKVDFNGADIPTYLKKGDSMTLPKAQLVYYDEDGKMQTAPGTQTIKAKVVNGDKTTEFTVSGDVSDEARTYKPENNGLVYVQYYAQLDGNTKYYTKDFTVKVQTEVKDNAAPTLSIVNVPTEASINRKVTLPTATVSDDLDENVKVEVTVMQGDQKVKQVTVDANGYADETLDADEVFDNDKLMSFYPTQLGDKNYTVTYQATDDAGKKSAPYTYKISGVDKVAPVFKVIDEHQIPEKWGLKVWTVEQKDGKVTETKKEVNAGISFPTPIVVDNAGDEGLTVSFKITNSDNATVMSFDNILDESEGTPGKIFTSNGANYGEKDEKFTFGTDKFDFNKVKNTDPQTGTYTVEYRAKDAKGNVATKTYKITVESTYKDEKAPVTAEVETPDYLIAKEGETFVVPTPSVADAEAATTRLHVEYEIVSDAPGTEPLKVKGGEKAEIVKEGDNLVFKIDDTQKLTLNKNLTFNLKVSDSVGLYKENKKDGASLNVVRVVSTTSVTNTPVITAAIQEQNTRDAAWTTKDQVNAGGFTIAVNEDDYPFTGFEVRVTNPKGETLDNVSLETYYDYSKIVVRNLTFTPGTSGTYQIAVRAFTLAEKNTVAIYPIVVEGDSTSGGNTDKPTTSAISMPTSGSAYTAYKLQDTRFDNIPGVDHAYLAHKITGAGFSLMGSEFIAYNQGTYQFTAGYVVPESGSVGDLEIRRTYSISTTDTEKPVIEVQGLMPTYAPKKVKDEDNNVILPAVVAIGEHGNAEIDIQITKNGEDVTATPTEDGGYSFEPRKDGAYTVTYTAALNGSDPVTATFTVNVGDVVAPDFKVTSTPAEKARINSEFKFSALTLESSEDSISDCTFTKKLIDPSKSEVVTVSGKGSTYATKTDNGATIKLDKSGTYTVVYEVSDEAGNKTTLQYQIVVSAQKSTSNISLTMISTVLIIVGVVLIAGVIIYFVRYRKVKPKKDKK